jgi:hypothetical protein
MIVEIQHETRFEYSETTIESLTELRMEPVSDSDQSCHSYHLAVTPPTEVFRYTDGFGNRVHHYNLLVPHSLVRILSASVVETHPGPRDLSASRSAAISPTCRPTAACAARAAANRSRCASRRASFPVCLHFRGKSSCRRSTCRCRRSSSARKPSCGQKKRHSSSKNWGHSQFHVVKLRMSLFLGKAAASEARMLVSQQRAASIREESFNFRLICA